MKIKNWKKYAFWILLTEAVGGLSAWLTREDTDIFNATITQPPLSPPPSFFRLYGAFCMH